MNEIIQSRRVAALQMVSSTCVEENIQRAENLIQQAAQQQVDWVVLPEYWILMGKHEYDKIAIAEDFGHGKIQNLLSLWAKQYNITLFSGSLPLRSENTHRVWNSQLTFSPNGSCISRYDKVHLFSFSGVGETYQESDTIMAGNQPVSLVHQHWKIAQGICYDLRFPEFFRMQTPFDVLILPAAFTQTTGKAHWHLLLRARAVENQAYVIAATQGGQHENGRTTFGHAMIIDPWGDVLSEHKKGEGMAIATIDLNRIASVRRHLPALDNRVF